MSKTKEKSSCELCGEMKQISSHLGKLVCSSCSVVRSSINARPQSVVDSLREIKGSLVQFLTEEEGNAAVQIYTKFAPKEENSGQLIKGGSMQEMLDTIDDLERQVGNEINDNIELTRINHNMSEQVKELSEENLRLKNEMSNVVSSVTSIDCDHSQELLDHKQEILDLENEVNCYKLENWNLFSELDNTKRSLARIIGTIGQSILEKHSKLPKTIYRELRRLAA